MSKLAHSNEETMEQIERMNEGKVDGPEPVEAELTDEQITQLRERYSIPANFVPVASAPGVIAWATESAARGES